MKVTATERGFPCLTHETYLPAHREHDRLVVQSSIVGEYEDAFERPGTSALWVGPYHHLNREEVAELAAHLRAWLETGSLIVAAKPPSARAGESAVEELARLGASLVLHDIAGRWVLQTSITVNSRFGWLEVCAARMAVHALHPSTPFADAVAAALGAWKSEAARLH